jgi:hypothetical protein
MNDAYPFLQFNTSATSFLARAKTHLREFQHTEAVEHFQYAALDLRFGIEARLNEYLGPALKAIGKDPKHITEYVANKLLNRLLTIDPAAWRAGTLRITNEQSGHATVLQFTPVSKRLAAIHGQLGELLHFKFFINNERWNMRQPLGGKPHRSLADYIGLLEEGFNELEHATSGQLLQNPKFTQLVEEVAGDIGGEPPTDDGV